MKLSVLDQSPVPAGSTPGEALRNTMDLARRADALGFARYWIAEHHAIETLASPAPEILIPLVAAETSRIRVGSGGVLLPHYSTLKVAEVFRMLHALYPGRIDLGLGRAPGSGGLEAFALQRDRSKRLQADDFTEQLTELLAFLHRDFPPEHPFSRIKISPDMPGAPDVWLLGSSAWSAAVAARYGLPYAFAHFIGPEQTVAALEHYRSHFTPSKFLDEPRAILTLGAVCADTLAEAERLAASTKLLIRRIRLGGPRRPVPTPEEAMAELETLGEDADPLTWDASEWPRYIVGDATKVRTALDSMARELQIEELMILTVIHDHRARVHSYELLAESFGLAKHMEGRARS
ncbi:MAG: LLM class flavin-dependent oxidoreductase [Acidobacteriia bacterium]|nr:LLM class flavin-dependent oxidoreductase [Terriglobia bacterium]